MTRAEQLLDLLPLDGRPMFYGELMYRARMMLRMSAGFAGEELTVLCSARLAVSEWRGGYHIVRRIPPHAEIFVARPRHVLRPLVRTRLHATPIRKAKAA